MTDSTLSAPLARLGVRPARPGASRLALVGMVVLALSLVGGAVSTVSAGAVPGYAYVPPAFAGSALSVGVAVDDSGGVSGGDVYVAALEGGSLGKFSAVGVELAQLGGSGFAPGDGPWAMGVDAATGDVYVSVEDPSPGKVDEIDPEGHEVALPAGAFQPTTEDAGVSEEEAVSYEPSGVAVDDSCYYQKLSEPACKAADPSNGDVYVADRHNGVLYRFTSEGKYEGRLGKGILASPVTLAIDSDGNVYAVSGASNVQKFSPLGESLGLFSEADRGSNAIAIDHSTGDVYVYEGSEGYVQQYSATGETISRFGAGIISYSYGIAVSESTHTVYVSALSPGEVLRFELGEAPETPVTGEATALTGTTALLHGVVNPNTAATVNYRFTYAPGLGCEGGEATILGEAATKEAAVEAEATGLSPKTKYTFCLVASNVFGSTFGAGVQFETLAGKPLIEEQAVIEPDGKTTATVTAKINPSGAGTTCKVEYGLSEAYGSEAPCPALGEPESTTGQPVSVELTGLEPGAPYHFRFVAENEISVKEGKPAEGEDKTFTTKVVEPVVINDPVLNVTRTTALLSGEINPDRSETSYHIEYGETTVYGALGSPTQAARMQANAGPLTIEPQTLGELKPGTTYHYRIVASNEAGATNGPDATFKTMPAQPPIVESEASTQVTQTTARITAIINPNGLQTNYILEVGADTSYGTPIYGEAGTESTELSLALTNLTPGATYHYQIVVTNQDGTVHGPSQMFTTPGSPTVIAPPAPVTLLAFAPPAETTPGETATKSKPLTRAQKLAKALKTCEKDKPRKKRAACIRQAHKKYGPAKKKRSRTTS